LDKGQLIILSQVLELFLCIFILFVLLSLHF
jgi:hypothetical protein